MISNTYIEKAPIQIKKGAGADFNDRLAPQSYITIKYIVPIQQKSPFKEPCEIFDLIIPFENNIKFQKNTSYVAKIEPMNPKSYMIEPR